MTGVSLKNPIAVLMVCIALVVFAAVVTPRMSVDTFPELTPPVLVIGTMAPGLGPKDVEKTITWRIEKYVSATPGVDHVESASRNNLSVVFVWLKWGTDLNSAQTLVQQQVAFAMSAVPKSLGVLPPFVLQYDPSNAPVVQVAVSGGGLTGPQLYDYALNNIEPVLEGIPGVASASLNGGRQRQINIVVDPARAQSRGVTSSDVAAAVGQANALLPSGKFISSDFDANVYTNAVAQRVRDMGEAPVKTKNGRAVLIRDVARVEDGGSPETQTVSVNGKDAVYLNVLRVPGGNTLQIVEEVQKAVSNLKNLPPGVEVKAIFDQSTFVRTSYEGLRKEILQALVLIALVILLFLQNVRAVLIAAVAIPISFAIILIVLYASGQTLNAFTLGGLTLAMGPLVDISVVVLESVHRLRGAGRSAQKSALEGTNAVAVPALAATLTTVAVLLPVVLLYGLAKKLFGPLALTVATA
ncbi:MAG: efflux RND transporter permease subunit, partial [Archangium sp.]